MNLGKGVGHSERTLIQSQDGKVYPIHGYQVWVAIPKEKEEIEVVLACVLLSLLSCEQ